MLPHLVSLLKCHILELKMTLESQQKLTPQELDQFASDYGFKIIPDLTESQRFELLSLLHKYKACFARNLKEMRRYENYELELVLKDKRPSFRRQHKLSRTS
jgi:hypothetical protein